MFHPLLDFGSHLSQRGILLIVLQDEADHELERLLEARLEQARVMKPRPS